MAVLTEVRAACTLLIAEGKPASAVSALAASIPGYRIREACCAAELFDALRADALPDLVLLDVMLAGADGFDVLAKMRSHPRFASLPVVMVAPGHAAASIDRALASGADGWLVTPCSRAALRKVIAGVLHG